MPGLLRGMARTAAVVGTASAVNGRVQRHQAAKFADRDAQVAAQQQAAYEQAAPPVYQAPPPPAAPAVDPIEQLKSLAELHSQGVLTDEEFAVQKSKILSQ